MRHKKAGRQFGRDTSSRRAMLRNLTANLITHERIETTDTKAKELRRVAERLISRARRLGKVAYTPNAELSPAERGRRLHAARLVGAYVPRWGVKADGTKVDIVEKVMVDLAKRFEGRPGGYTRIIKIGPRAGDNAPMSYIELVDAPSVDAASLDAAGASAATAEEASPAAATTAEAEGDK
jgi:large subunit ribosomal protein L17